MKRFLFVAGLAASMSSLFAVPVALTSSQISPDPNSYINFLQNGISGGNTAFTFQNGDSHFAFFSSASPSAPYLALDNLHIDITGTYDIVASTFTTDASGNQMASIINDPTSLVNEQLKIFGDGSGNSANAGILTADLNWVNILSNSFQTGQNLNITGTLNLSNFQYTANGDSQAVQDALNSLVQSAPGRLTLSVTGSGLPQVSDLLALNAHNKIGTLSDGSGAGAFSLNLSTVPEPRFYGLLLVGLIGVAAIVVRRKSIA